MSILSHYEATNMNHLCFNSLTKEDLNLLYIWFQEPVIFKQYARKQYFSEQMIEQKYLPRIKGIEKVPSFIIQYQNQPIGFIQYYSLIDSLPEGIRSQSHRMFQLLKPHEIAGIDLFIADNSYRNQGLGKQILEQFMLKFLQPIFKMLIVDPEHNNQQAIRCYEKAGFKKTDFSEVPEFLIMSKTL